MAISPVNPILNPPSVEIQIIISPSVAEQIERIAQLYAENLGGNPIHVNFIFENPSDSLEKEGEKLP